MVRVAESVPATPYILWSLRVQGPLQKTMSRRERMVMVDPRGSGMVLLTLRAANEVRPPQFGKADGTIDAEMLAIALRLSDSGSGNLIRAGSETVTKSH